MSYKCNFIKFLILIFFNLLLFLYGSSTAYADEIEPSLNSSKTITANSSSNKKIFNLSILGQPKYPDNFTHFDYVNPNAPKGGQIIFSAIGTFDNFNRYALRGVAGERTGKLYDQLFVASLDDPSTIYPLIGRHIELSEDLKTAIVSLNPKAKFHDGKPITSEDVLFTFEKFYTEGVPQFKKTFEGITLDKLDDLTFKINLPTADKSLLSDFLTLIVLPKHEWENLNLSEPLTTPPLGSGSYRISDYKMGQYIIYERVKDYWAQDLPVNKGQNNFDTIRYDYYLDASVTLEAFKTGAFDFQFENKAKNWATSYQGKNFDNGNIIKVQRANEGAVSTQWLAFNINQPQFMNRKVREAISYAFHFEWINKMLFYDSYARVQSFFQNSPYQAKNKPSKAALAILTPFKDNLPPEVFGDAYVAPFNDEDPFNRRNLTHALELLQQAGYELVDGQLQHSKTKQNLDFELLVYKGTSTEHLLPFAQGLKKLGITMTVREVDVSQYIKRMRDRDYDMIVKGFSPQLFPDSSLLYYWHSSYLDSTYNASGVSDPVIDHLIEEIINAQGDQDKLMTLGEALDRVLTWQYYMIPQWYGAYSRFAYWNKFGLPQTYPLFDIGLDTWWFDENKANSLKQ